MGVCNWVSFGDGVFWDYIVVQGFWFGLCWVQVDLFYYDFKKLLLSGCFDFQKCVVGGFKNLGSFGMRILGFKGIQSYVSCVQWVVCLDIQSLVLYFLEGFVVWFFG